MTEESEGIKVNRDRFGGLIINSNEQECSHEDFGQRLAAAIPQWREQGIRGLWMKIAKEHSALVPILTKLDFEFHHAKPGHVMMTFWLPTEEKNILPEYANQYLGVGGFVVNDKNEVLVIQERFNMGVKHWKLPGGCTDQGEDLEVTAKREVLEETGIEAEFVCVIAFRHQHDFRFGCSDWYFVCLMKAVGGTINPCPQEIAECRWMDIDEYANHPSLTATNKAIVKYYKEMVARGNSAVIAQENVLSFNKSKYNKIYCIKQQAPTVTESKLDASL